MIFASIFGTMEHSYLNTLLCYNTVIWKKTTYQRLYDIIDQEWRPKKRSDRDTDIERAHYGIHNYGFR